MLSELLSDVRYRLRALFQRGALERELSDELHFHVEREAEKNVRLGMTPEEAMRRARVSFGGVERFKEESRDARGLSALEAVGQDLRYAFRTLRASPGFTAAVVLTLGLGIGSNAAMFGIVDRLLFRPPPYLRQPATAHRIYLTTSYRQKDYTDSSMEYTRYLDLTRWTRSFSATAAWHLPRVAVGVGQDAREMLIGTVSASFFGFFDIHPVIGRFFTAAEDQVPKGTPVAVLSHAFWQSRYGGRGDVLGTTLPIGALTYSIIGVAPSGFVGVGDGAPPVAFVPITSYAGTATWTKDQTDYYTAYHWGWMQMLGRRKPEVSVEAASADLANAFVRSYAAQSALSPQGAPVTVARPRAVLAPVQHARGPNESTVAKLATWVTGVAAIVLIIACANVANLLLARALKRRREIALRLALGVSRLRLLSQLLTESIVLAALGGALGLIIARFGGTVLRALFLPADAGSGSILDLRTIAFAAVVALLAGILTGLAPVLQARRADLASALKTGARDGTYHQSRTRSGLLVLQGALSVVLLIGAGLFVRSLQNVEQTRLGYDVDPVLYVDPTLRGVDLSNDERAALGKRLLEAANAIPGVETATRAVTVPFWTSMSTDLFVAGIDSVRKLGTFQLQSSSPEYFATIGTRILRGRGLEAGDRKGAPLVAVVSEAMAKTLWPGKDAIGQCFKVDADSLPCTTVVGIAEGIKQRSLSDDPGLQYYLSIEQFHPEDMALFVRMRGDAADQAETVRRLLQPVMPGGSYLAVTSMREIIDPQTQSWRLGATMFVVFGGLALVLAAIGLYSVIAYNVAQRRQELGVRIALGAQAADVLRLVVGEGVRFAVAGILIGGAIAFLAGRWIGPLLFAQSPHDPLVFGAVTGVLLAVAVAASVIPARRASQVDPNVALRAD
ncbi:MAG: ABC transporter permease [Gemmatimonadota bacterium]